ncbi:MAG TPA: PEP-CTERM sorting domain-containing protein [Bryobacteraceae bacterium]|nr:PEP-CTERM sorting domain-containing protein [Bryobacteraceae bacterium]
MITGNFGTFISLAQSHIGPNALAHTSKLLTLRTSLGAYVGKLGAALLINRYSHAFNDHRGKALFYAASAGGAVFTNGLQIYGSRSLQRFPLSQPVSGDHTHPFGSLCRRETGRFILGTTVNRLYGEFASGVPGYAGFKLANGDIGWIQLTWSSQAGNRFPDRLAFGNWAVSTAGGILAGTTIPAAPEPGTFPLALLACGAAGIAAWRKRRAAAAQSAPIADIG